MTHRYRPMGAPVVATAGMEPGAGKEATGPPSGNDAAGGRPGPAAGPGTAGYWLTPLARKPPSTTSTWPVTKLAASDARNTAAPASSSTSPNRFMGVRRRNSRPRSVPSSRAVFKGVRKTPGAIAFTHTPWGAHSIARDLVREATAALLAA